MEAARLLSRHPRFVLSLATSDKWGGRALGSKLALPPETSALVCVSQEQGKTAFGSVDVLFLCTPAEVSIELAALAHEQQEVELVRTHLSNAIDLLRPVMKRTRLHLRARNDLAQAEQKLREWGSGGAL